MKSWKKEECWRFQQKSMKKKYLVFLSVMLLLISGSVACSTQTKESDVSVREEKKEGVANEDKPVRKSQYFAGIGIEEEEKGKEDEKETSGGNKISKDTALTIIEDKFGPNREFNEEEKEETSYVYENMQTVNGAEFYNFRYSVISYEQSGETKDISKVGNIFVSMDGLTVAFAEELEDGWRLLGESEIKQMFVSKDSAQNAVLILNSDYTFQFTYDSLSSYLPYGEFYIEDGKLLCDTIDGKYCFVFDIVDNSQISFDAESSSIPPASDGSSVALENGDILVLSGE